MKIVFLDEYTLGYADLAPLKLLGDYTGYNDTPVELIVERCRGAQVIITNKMPLRQQTLAQLPDLKLICLAATGMNNIDLEAAAEAGVVVRNAADYSSYSVAEHTFMGVLALYKQTLYLDEYVKNGAYTSSGRLFNYDRPMRELYGKRWGIIGMGNIGRRVARLAGAFGCEVGYYSTSGNNDNGDYTRMPLEELLAWADIVSIHAPLSRKTYHMIGYPQLSLMKRRAVLVNVARGNLVDEEALARALNEGLIAGAALDVYGREPMAADNPLNTVADPYKLVLTPHSAWSTEEALRSLVGKIAENITEFFKENG